MLDTIDAANAAQDQVIHPDGCQCVSCKRQRHAVNKAIADHILSCYMKHAEDELDRAIKETDFIEETAQTTGADREMVEKIAADFPLDRLLDLVGKQPASRPANRQRSINSELHIETVTSLDFMRAVAAAERGGKWGAIKALSGPEAEAFLAPAERLLTALPSLIHQLRERIRVSIDQGQKSLEMKRLKREEREAAGRAAEAEGGEDAEAEAEAEVEAEAADADAEAEASASVAEAETETAAQEDDDADWEANAPAEDPEDGDTEEDYEAAMPRSLR